MNKELRHIGIAFAVVCAVALVRCANRMTPTGGPKDTLPPRVKLITPEAGQRLFDAKRITVDFDEYFVLKDQAKEFFTSPMMATKPTFTIRDRSLRIDIKDTLPPNQTYALNFGTMIRDNNEGNPLYGFRYVFSTGPAIDSMIMTGYTADAAKGDSVSRAFLFFYDARRDSIPYNDSLVYVARPGVDSLLFVAKPDAVARAEGNGIFIAQNIKDIPYRIYAVQDNNGNLKYDPGVDKVGFSDQNYDPSDSSLPSFAIWLDEYRHYPTADPQIYIRMFGETPVRRQNLVGTERPGQNQAILRFSSPFPQIDSLVFDSIPEKNVVREYLTSGRDTISLWFNAQNLPDTIKGRISYMRTDSLGNLSPHSQPLKLAWRHIETREEERERNRLERDRERAERDGEEYTPPPQPNPFKFKVDASGEVNPEKGIPIEFELPLAQIDSTRISLTSTPAPPTGAAAARPQSGASSATPAEEPKPAPFHFVQDTTNIRKWTITSKWDESQSYKLMIPAGTFVDFAGNTNDTLKADFKILQASKFATLQLAVKGKTMSDKYIVQILGGTGTTPIKEMKGIHTGNYTIPYIPEGQVRIRITEDGNGNGKWDTGSLVEHRQPERVEFYVGPTGSQTLPTRSNWEVDATLDMGAIFGPVSIEKVRADLQKAEDARVTKWMEDKAKRDEDKKKQERQGAGSGGLGIGGALGGARQQIQSTVR